MKALPGKLDKLGVKVVRPDSLEVLQDAPLLPSTGVVAAADGSTTRRHYGIPSNGGTGSGGSSDDGSDDDDEYENADARFSR